MRVEIIKDGKTGEVIYDEKLHLVTVNFEGPKAAAEKHLTAKRDFRIPTSQETDDFRVDNARPTDSRTYMELALCTLYAEAGFWVNWETLKED